MSGEQPADPLPADLLAELSGVRERVVVDGARIRARWDPTITRGAFRDSAVNLAQFLAYRRLDLRPLQAALAPWGLASLSRLESRVLPTLDAIIANLQDDLRLAGHRDAPQPGGFRGRGAGAGREYARGVRHRA